MNENQNHTTFFHDLGHISYAEALARQLNYFNKILSIKGNNRQTDTAKIRTPNFLFFCEHPHVYTLGKSGLKSNLLISIEELESLGAEYFETNRGGDITYHGPGQLVVYPIIDLENFFTDIHRYMRYLEESVILTLHDFGIYGERIHGLTGVWVGGSDPPKKICAMGVKTSRWVAMHGLSLNVNVDLTYFDYIVPCGIKEKAVTSMAHEAKKILNMEAVKKTMIKHLSATFNMDVVYTPHQSAQVL